MESGMIGGLETIVARFGGRLVHTGTHAFGVMRWRGGEVEWVEGEIEMHCGTFIRDSSEDHGGGGAARLKFKNGMPGFVSAESKDYFLFKFDMIGPKGRILIGDNEVLAYYALKESTHYTGLKEPYKESFPAFEARYWRVEALKNLGEGIKTLKLRDEGEGRGFYGGWQEGLCVAP